MIDLYLLMDIKWYFICWFSTCPNANNFIFTIELFPNIEGLKIFSNKEESAYVISINNFILVQLLCAVLVHADLTICGFQIVDGPTEDHPDTTGTLFWLHLEGFLRSAEAMGICVWPLQASENLQMRLELISGHFWRLQMAQISGFGHLRILASSGVPGMEPCR